jgi:protein SCO1/2
LDEAGNAVRLGDYFGDKPVVLALGYYECPMLCSLVREGLVQAIDNVTLDVGSDYQVVYVSIDPAETPMNAANTKATVVAQYGRPGSEAGWHFLTGPQDSIQRLADAVGFVYFYDETIDQYAHAAGITVLTPGGTLARYFYGIEYNPSDLRLGLVEASDSRIGSPVDQLLLLCYSYDPTTGKYTGLVMTLVRVAGALFAIGLVALILFLNRETGRPGSPPGPAPAAG